MYFIEEKPLARVVFIKTFIKNSLSFCASPCQNWVSLDQTKVAYIRKKPLVIKIFIIFFFVISLLLHVVREITKKKYIARLGNPAQQ